MILKFLDYNLRQLESTKSLICALQIYTCYLSPEIIIRHLSIFINFIITFYKFVISKRIDFIISSIYFTFYMSN